MDRGIGLNVSLGRTPSEQGGFGLFNIRERLHLLGGELDVTSVPGRGTTAKIVVPLNPVTSVQDHRSAERAGQSEDRDGAACVRPGPVRVVLTDDHQMMREGLRRAMEASGDVEVVAEAADGEMAVQLVRDMRPDVVVMDVSMPRMNGVEATRRIKTEFPSIAVIGISVCAGGWRNALSVPILLIDSHATWSSLSSPKWTRLDRLAATL